MSGYTKLYSTILDSSVWLLDANTRIVWITMLAMASKEGIVHASVGALARRANVPIEACRRALTELEAPDEDDKSGVEDGRRLRRLQGSWEILNFQFYREARGLDAVRKAQWRERRKAEEQQRTPSQSVQDSDNESRTVVTPKVSIASGAVAGAASGSPSGSGSERGVQGGVDPEPPGTEPAVWRTLAGWEIPATLYAEAQFNYGLTREELEDRVTSLRTGPIGGRRGVLDRTDYVRAQFGKWKVWAETERAKPRTGGGAGGGYISRQERELREQAARIEHLREREAAE